MGGMSSLSATRNPILQAVGLIVGALVTVIAILIGAVMLSLGIGLVVLVGLVMFVRVRWLKHRMKQTGSPTDDIPSGEITGVEYTVIKERAIDE